MKTLSIIMSHWRNWKWLPIAIHAFKKYPFSIGSEILVADNSPGHPSIKSITETELGEGVQIVQGDPELPSHGHGYDLCYEQAVGDWIFTTETDALPTRHGWGEDYIKASADYDYIGPHMHLGGGIFIHPAGAACSRKVVEAAKAWRAKYPQWVFVPGAAVALGVSDKAYHVVAREDWLATKEPSADIINAIRIWEKAGPWQTMISWEDDTFDTYNLRNGIKHWSPRDKPYHLRIGYEPGQHLSYFAKDHFRCMHAPVRIEWMPGYHNRQAAYSDIFGGSFRHIWAGTSSFCDGIEPPVREYKSKQLDFYFSQLPDKLQQQILKLEREHTTT